MAIRIKGIRGPASYSSGGFPVTLGRYQSIASGSGRMVGVLVTSSTPYLAQAVSNSANVVTVRLWDSRSGNIEVPGATDVSTMQMAMIYEGV